MSNPRAGLREKLSHRYDAHVVSPIHAARADHGRTEKALLELAPPSARLLEGPLAERRRRFNSVEAVLMIYPSKQVRRTVCVSSQAGCAMACEFCATGRSGFVRTLAAGAIVRPGRH